MVTKLPIDSTVTWLFFVFLLLAYNLGFLIFNTKASCIQDQNFKLILKI